MAVGRHFRVQNILLHTHSVDIVLVFPLAPEHSVAAKSGGCFPGDTWVTLEGGATKPMRDLRPGDRVLTSAAANGRGPLVFSPVLSFLDRQPGAAKTFYVIGTRAGLNITLTAAHLIFVTDCSPLAETHEDSKRELRTVFASEVQPGQCVLTARSKAALSAVTFVEEQSGSGLYAPVTGSGSIVVNGVLASCYAALDSHRLAHWVLAPLRFFYSLMGPSEAQSDGLHWYPRLLQRLGRTLLDSGHFHPRGLE